MAPFIEKNESVTLSCILVILSLALPSSISKALTGASTHQHAPQSTHEHHLKANCHSKGGAGGGWLTALLLCAARGATLRRRHARRQWRLVPPTTFNIVLLKGEAPVHTSCFTKCLCAVFQIPLHQCETSHSSTKFYKLYTYYQISEGIYHHSFGSRLGALCFFWWSFQMLDSGY